MCRASVHACAGGGAATRWRGWVAFVYYMCSSEVSCDAGWTPHCLLCVCLRPPACPSVRLSVSQPAALLNSTLQFSTRSRRTEGPPALNMTYHSCPLAARKLIEPVHLLRLLRLRLHPSTPRLPHPSSLAIAPGSRRLVHSYIPGTNFDFFPPLPSAVQKTTRVIAQRGGVKMRQVKWGSESAHPASCGTTAITDLARQYSHASHFVGARHHFSPSLTGCEDGRSHRDASTLSLEFIFGLV